jgi:hypothetical protein
MLKCVASRRESISPALNRKLPGRWQKRRSQYEEKKNRLDIRGNCHAVKRWPGRCAQQERARQPEACLGGTDLNCLGLQTVPTSR